MDTLTGSPSHITFNWPHEHEAILETILPSHPSSRVVRYCASLTDAHNLHTESLSVSGNVRGRERGKYPSITMWMVSDDGWMNCFSIFKASSPVLAAAVADHVSCWPEAEVLRCPLFGRDQAESRHDSNIAKATLLTLNVTVLRNLVEMRHEQSAATWNY
jgi:hypothetical protein